MQTKKVNSLKLTDEQKKTYNALVGLASKVRWLNANITTDRGDLMRLASELENRPIRYQHIRGILTYQLKQA